MNPEFAPTELRSGLTDALDWNMWLGPAPEVPFDPFRFAYNWRWFWDYSGGQMTNWGAHSLDIARWALDAVAPTAVAAFGGRYELKDGGQTPDVQEALYSFPGCIVSWTGREINGVEAIRPLPPFQSQGHRPLLEFHGTKGNMILTRERFDVTPEAWSGAGQDAKTPAIQPLKGVGSNLGALPCTQLSRLCQESQKTGCRYRRRLPHRCHVPTRQHRNESGPYFALGPGKGRSHRRQRSKPAVIPALSKTLDT